MILFELGQEVVCVNDKSIYGVIMPITEGHHYFVKGFHTCSCGCVGIDIGASSISEEMICTSCFTRHRSDIWFLRQERFAPLSHIDNVNELIEELKYETA